MPTEVSLLWLVVTSGLILTMMLMLMMYTRKRLALVHDAIAHTGRVINTDRIDVVERQVQMMFDLIERRLASLLHAPHLPEMDRLLKKVKDQTITPEQAVELYTMLIERRADLVIEGVARPDLDFPELFVLWSLEVRIARAGLEIPRQQLSTRPREPPREEGT